MNILLATTNTWKLREVAAAFSGLNIRLSCLDDLPDFPRVEETGLTFEENALKKAREIWRWSGQTTLADDSGLVVPALGGHPGIYSARYAGEGATDEENLQKLITEVSKVPEGQRQAYYVCVLALVDPSGKELVMEGRCHGEIILDRRGTGGFGYDPVFYLPEMHKTMAELPLELKNQISHRGRALLQMDIRKNF